VHLAAFASADAAADQHRRDVETAPFEAGDAAPPQHACAACGQCLSGGVADIAQILRQFPPQPLAFRRQ